MSNLHIQFGKYQEDTFEEILRKDVPYCRWLLKSDNLDIDIKDYLSANLPKDEGYLMPFGKYKGKPLEYIKRTDNAYIKWLKKNEYVQKQMPALSKLLVNECPLI